MAIYRGTGGWSNTTGTAEADAVVAAQVAVQNALTQIKTDLTASGSYKNQAEAAAITATNSATGIEGYATLAATKAVAASASATASANSATASANSANSASTSASTATTQAGIATTKATEAATSATNAANSATTASTQATNAASSATSAANSATTATTQATNASNSATAAATSATNAASSATAAAASAAAAATFDPSSYYTKTNLDSGQLDNRYYTETEVNTALAGKEPTITTLPVSKGGTGATTLTGLVKGNGTGAMTAAVADTDYVTPSGTSTLNNKTFKGVFIDKTTTNAAATGTVTLNIATADVFNLTLSGNTTVALSNIPTLSNETFAFVVRVSQGGTAYTLTWFSGITWLTTGGTAPAAPAASKSVEYIFSTTDGTSWTGRKGAAN